MPVLTGAFSTSPYTVKDVGILGRSFFKNTVFFSTNGYFYPYTPKGFQGIIITKPKEQIWQRERGE